MRVLFVCTGNVFRSMTAEYCFNQYIGHSDMRAESAGTSTSHQDIDSDLLSELAKYGIDAHGHKYRQVTEEIIDASDIIIAMADYHQDYLKEHFGAKSFLFNEISLGEKTSVNDLGEGAPMPETRQEFLEFWRQKVKHIHDSIPLLAANLQKFTI